MLRGLSSRLVDVAVRTWRLLGGRHGHCRARNGFNGRYTPRNGFDSKPYYKDCTNSVTGLIGEFLTNFRRPKIISFGGCLGLKCPFLSSGTQKIGSGRSNLYVGRWSRGRLTPQRAGTWDNYKDYTYVGTLDGLYQHTLIATGTISFFKMRLEEAHLSITLPDLPIEKKEPKCPKN